MFNNTIFKKLLYSLAFLLLLTGSFSVDLGVSRAEEYDFVGDSGLGATAEKTGHTQQKLFNSAESIDSSISSIITAVISFLGVIFLILTIYGGLMWMTARGNDDRVKRAKEIVIDSITGLIIVVAAYAITYFVTSVFIAKTLAQ